MLICAWQKQNSLILSAIGDRINQSGHAASLKDFSILDRAKNEFDLLIHESLLILRDQNLIPNSRLFPWLSFNLFIHFHFKSFIHEISSANKSNTTE